MATKEQRDTIEYVRRERREWVHGHDLHIVVDDDNDDVEIHSRERQPHRSSASRLWRELADTCADCGGSTAYGSPDPHECE